MALKEEFSEYEVPREITGVFRRALSKKDERIWGMFKDFIGEEVTRLKKEWEEEKPVGPTLLNIKEIGSRPSPELSEREIIQFIFDYFYFRDPRPSTEESLEERFKKYVAKRDTRLGKYLDKLMGKVDPEIRE